MLRLVAALDEQLLKLQLGCDDVEFSEHRRLFGIAMSALIDIANPIYRAHPHLKPIQLGGSYIDSPLNAKRDEDRLGSG